MKMGPACQCRQQPGDDEFTPEQWTQIDAIIEKYKSKPGALILALAEIQDISGYLPEVIQRRVAKGMNLPISQIYGVVTFYSFFTMVPRGKHQIRVCLGTACHVRGGHRIVEELENKLGIGPGECTEDRLFSIDIVRCVGACGVAPVMVVDDKVHKQVKAAKLEETLRKYR